MLDFEKVLATIQRIKEKSAGLTFEQTAHALSGYNCDGELFDYDYGIDDRFYLVGTVYNDNGKPYFCEYKSYYEIWTTEEGRFPYQVLSMTEKELKEQVNRLK